MDPSILNELLFLILGLILHSLYFLIIFG
jgi:GIY-YIG domain-containing protein